MQNPVLHHIPFSRSTMILWMLEELHIEYDLKVDHRDRSQRDKRFKEISPFGKVPVLEFQGEVLSEAAAIVLYLSEKFPKSKLGIDPELNLRFEFLRLLFWGRSCLEPAILERMFQREPVDDGSTGWKDCEEQFDYLASCLKGKQYLLGDHFSAVDLCIGSQLRWAQAVDVLKSQPELEEYLDRLNERAAWKRVFEMECKLSS